MLRRILENKLVLAAIALTIAVSLGSHAVPRVDVSAGPVLIVPQSGYVAHGPSLPPDPWAGDDTTQLTRNRVA